MKIYSFVLRLSLGLNLCISCNAWADEALPVPDAKDTPIAWDLNSSCKKPKSPLYKTDDINKPVHAKIIVDYAKLNSQEAIEPEIGVVSIVNSLNQPEFTPVLLSSRGNSRKYYCSAPPLRMAFLGEDLKAKVESTLQTKKIKPTDKNYLKTYLELVKSEYQSSKSEPTKQTAGMFSKLGDDIKIVTHCGTSEWEFVGGVDAAAQDVKLLSEFYVYQMLGTLKLPIETTRLAKIEYQNPDGSPVYSEKDAQGILVHEKIAMFREPPRSIEKRCQLGSGGQYGTGEPNKVSEFQANFVNYFVINNDFGTEYAHNINYFSDINHQTAYGAYDFDLSGIFEPNYFKNLGDLNESFDSLKYFVEQSDKEIAASTMKRILAQKQKIQDILNSSLLPKERKAMFQKWFDIFMPGIETLSK